MTQAKKPILIVEDDPDIRDSIQQVLEMEGFEVFTANNGKEGLEALNRIPHPCVIVLDFFMPVMDGGQFVEDLKKNGSDELLSIPILLTSAAPPQGSDLQKIRASVSAFVKKPIELDGFLKVIEQQCLIGSNGNRKAG